MKLRASESYDQSVIAARPYYEKAVEVSTPAWEKAKEIGKHYLVHTNLPNVERRVIKEVD